MTRDGMRAMTRGDAHAPKRPPGAPRAGQRFRRRWRRVVSAAMLVCTVVACAVAAGCSGRVRVQGSPWGDGEIEVEVRRGTPASGTRVCGTLIHDGRTYELHCDGQGRIILARDVVTGRWYRVIMDPLPMLPDDLPQFMHDGIHYALPPAPPRLVLEVPDGAPTDVLAEWGGSVAPDGAVIAGGAWSYDRGADVLDLSLCLDWSVPLPDPGTFDLSFELIVLPDPVLGLMLHRVVGPRAEVIRYGDALGVSVVDLTVDGYGPVPGGLIELLARITMPPDPS